MHLIFGRKLINLQSYLGCVSVRSHLIAESRQAGKNLTDVLVFNKFYEDPIFIPFKMGSRIYLIRNSKNISCDRSQLAIRNRPHYYITTKFQIGMLEERLLSDLKQMMAMRMEISEDSHNMFDQKIDLIRYLSALSVL